MTRFKFQRTPRKFQKRPSLIYKTLSGLLLGLLLFAVVAGTLSGCQTLETKLGGDAPEKPLLHDLLNRKSLVAGIKFDTPPFGALNSNGLVQGYDVDVVREVAQRLGKKHHQVLQVDFQQVISSTRIIGLNLGRLDLVAATMTITPEREKLIDFSDSYFVAAQAVMVPAKSSMRRITDLKGKTILYVIGTTSEKTIKKVVPGAVFRGYKTIEGAFEALKRGEAQAFTNDDVVLYPLMGKECQYRLLPERLSQESYGLGIREHSERQNTKAFRSEVNDILNDMKRDGTLQRLRQKWIQPYEAQADCATS